MFRPAALPILLALLCSACTTPTGSAPAKSATPQARPPAAPASDTHAAPADGPPSAAKAAVPAAPPTPPDRILNGKKPPAAVADCIADGLGQWKIPAAFIARDRLDDGTQIVRLGNPAGAAGGPEVFIRPREAASRLEIYRHGLEMGSGWKRLLTHCSR